MNSSNSSNSIKRKTTSLTQTKVQEIVSETVNTIKQALRRGKIDQIAWETGFVKRSSSRIGGKDFLISMLLASLDTSHTSLERISILLAQVNPKTQITPQSLMERINSSAAPTFFLKIHEMFLKNRAQEWMKNVPPYLLSYFSMVLIQDSTVFELNESLQEHFKGSGGRSSKSCIKIDVIYDLLAKQYKKFTVTDQKQTDSSLAITIEEVLDENSLVIRDLGYLRIDSLRDIIKKKGHYLSRLKATFQVFLDPYSEAEIDLNDCFGDGENLIDLEVYLTKDRFPARLIAYRAPPKVINQRKRLALATAKKQGRTLSKKSLKMLEFTVFITNVPPNYWPPEVVGPIYSARWQIELLFKNWKTGMGIHYLKGINPNRIKVLIYARLMLMLIINKIYKLSSWLGENIGKNISMHKVFCWMKDPGRLQRILKGTLKTQEKRYFLKVVLKGMCQQKRKRKTTMEAIYEGVFYSEYYRLA